MAVVGVGRNHGRKLIAKRPKRGTDREYSAYVSRGGVVAKNRSGRSLLDPPNVVRGRLRWRTTSRAYTGPAVHGYYLRGVGARAVTTTTKNTRRENARACYIKRHYGRTRKGNKGNVPAWDSSKSTGRHNTRIQ